MEILRFLKIKLMLTLLILGCFGCESNNSIRIDTPYGIGLKANDTRAITDKEIEYFIIKDDFIYFYKKDFDVATYILPKDNITLITPLEKP